MTRSLIAEGIPEFPGTPIGWLARADLVGLRQNRHLHRVVVAVIAALHLDDQIAPGQRPRQMHGVHGGFGARVGEPPQGQVEAPGQLAGDPDRVLGRLGEVRAAPHPVADRRDDGRMCVSGNGSAVAAVHVDVLGAVNVVDLRALAVAHPDGLRLGDLPVGRRPACEVFAGHCDQFGAAWLAAQEHLLLVGDQLIYGVGHRALHHRRSHGETSVPERLTEHSVYARVLPATRREINGEAPMPTPPTRRQFLARAAILAAGAPTLGAFLQRARSRAPSSSARA